MGGIQMNAIGITITPVQMDKIEVAAYRELLSSPGSIVGIILRVKVPLGDGENADVLVMVNSYRAENPLAFEAEIARYLSELTKKTKAVKNIIELREALVLECEPLTAFNSKGERIPLTFPLRPFLEVYEVEKDFFVRRFSHLKNYFASGRLWFMGRAYGSGLLHPVWLAEPQAAGEAHHSIIVGQTGSGKSTLAKMLLLGYAALSQKVNLFVLDPVGEFSRAFNNQDTGIFQLQLKTLWQQIGRQPPEIYTLDKLTLNRWEIFQELMVQEEVFVKLHIKHKENQQRAAEWLTARLQSQRVKLQKLKQEIKNREQTIRNFLQSDDFLLYTYRSPAHQSDIKKAISDPNRWNDFMRSFMKIAEMFDWSSGKVSIRKLVWSMLLKDSVGRTVILDLSKYNWENPVKYLLIKEVLNYLYWAAQKAYLKRGGAVANTIVVIDEGHRIAPSRQLLAGGEKEYQEACRQALVKGYVETRKFGLSWMVISTRLALIDHNLHEHARTKFIGWGLGTGQDADILREFFGREFLEVYRRLPDPSDPLSPRRHVFAVYGPICVISRIKPEFIEVFNDPQEFLRINEILKNGEDLVKASPEVQGVKKQSKPKPSAMPLFETT